MCRYTNVVDYWRVKYTSVMVYQVVKTIKGRKYVYEQRTWREGRRVRTESHYIGPAGGGPPRKKRLARKIAKFIKANMNPPRHLIFDEEQMLKEYNERSAREQQAREALLGELHDKFGLRVADTPRAAPEPQNPAAPAPGPDNTAALAPVTEAEAKESPSTDEGQDAQNS